MVSRRSKSKRAEPLGNAESIEVEPFDLASWARRLIEGLPDDTPAEELALLKSQVSALSAAAPAADTPTARSPVEAPSETRRSAKPSKSRQPQPSQEEEDVVVHLDDIASVCIMLIR